MIPVEVVPNVLQPDMERMDFHRVKQDIKKFFEGSRLFTEEARFEWVNLLDESNSNFCTKEKPTTWPLIQVMETKQQQKPSESTTAQGFLGERPDGVPEDLDQMVRDQIAPIPEVV